MDYDAFDEMLTMVTPMIEKMKTVMREPISPSQRLSITLRYLATGNTFEDLNKLKNKLSALFFCCHVDVICTVSRSRLTDIVQKYCSKAIHHTILLHNRQ